MRRRRRPLMRAAMVGGAGYYAGKRMQEGRERDAELEQYQQAEAQAAAAPQGGMTDAKINQLRQLGQLHDQGILTDAEFDEQKRELLQS